MATLLCACALIWIIAFFVRTTPAKARIFKPCELGVILLEQGIDFERLGDWICLAHASSRYDSSQISGHETNPYNNLQYGIYQISNYFYCYDIYKPTFNDCGLNCSELVDDDLVDDIRCAKLIYRRSNNSFRGWQQFGTFCNNSNGNADFYESCDFANGAKPVINEKHKTNLTLFLTLLTPGQRILECEANGTLPIDITWTKNRKPFSTTDPDFRATSSVNESLNQSSSVIFLRHVEFSLNEYVTLLTCEARNRYGRDSVDFLVKIIEPPDGSDDPPDDPATKAMELGLTILVTAIIILTIAAVVLRNIMRQPNGLTAAEIDAFRNGDDSEKIVISAEYIHETLHSKPYNKDFEISKRDLKIEKRDLLGKGQFGLVYKGLYRDKTVAVKTLRPGAEKAYLQALLSELKVMIYVKGHDNVTEVIGAYTKGLDKGVLYVLIEFCSLGSLLEYLRSYREALDDPSDPGSTKGRQRVVIDNQRMLSWSYQIASAMEYLSAKKVVHGDLATRNVLLTCPEVAKIADFGLSKKLYNYSTYVKGDGEGGPLPWRWLAPETLRDLKFSASSDVWAFGVTLWEIFSYAEIPYPGLEWTSDFLRHLEGGLRLSKPNDASFSLFKIMESCWKLNERERPSFTLLRQNLYLEDVSRLSTQDYVNQNLSSNSAKDLAYRKVNFIPNIV